MEQQTTIKSPFTLSGPGLHTGQYTHATVKPAAAGTGIILRRTDVPCSADIPALAENVSGTDHGTTVTVGGNSVSTIEHLMSAFHGLQIDNALVELDGPEVPILDGSARLWVENIANVGVTPLNMERNYFRLSEPVRYEDPSSGIILEGTPADDFVVDSTISFKSSLIGSQNAVFSNYGSYSDQFASCRTFVFLHEVEFLLANNLIKGGDLDNAIVFVDKPLGDDEKRRLAALFNKDADTIQEHNGVLNTIQPFFPNEPARHKLLDFMGDIFLTGRFLNGHFSLHCPGHRANVELAKMIRKMIK